MSSDDGWFKRWGKSMPFGPWPDADVEEMMKEMEKSFMELDVEDMVPKELIKEKRAEDGSITKEIGPIVYGYSVTTGPDGKPVIKEFGNVKPGPSKEWKEAITDTREPLVEVVEGEKDVRVIAEIPGASANDIVLTTEGKKLLISAETPARKYYKSVELPAAIDRADSSSKFNNGILEVTFHRRKGSKSSKRRTG